MGFFASFWATLEALLRDYISINTQRVATMLEPTLFTCAVVYVMVWGYLQMTGKMEEPLVTGLKRIMLLGLVFAVSLRLWVYHDVIVNLFYEGPREFTQAMFRVREPVGAIDAIWTHGSHVAENLMSRSTLMSGWGFAMTAIAVWVFVGWLCVYTMYLIAFSKVALAVLLALGPFFLIMMLFDATRDYFSRWIAQLSVYALTIILTIMTSALILQVVQVYAEKTAAHGSAILTVDALDMVLISVLAVFFMMQVMGIAGSLGGSFAANLQGAMQRSYQLWGRKLALVGGVGFGMGRGIGRFGHGAFAGGDAQEGDPFGRRLGRRAGNAMRRLVPRSKNTIKPA